MPQFIEEPRGLISQNTMTDLGHPAAPLSASKSIPEIVKRNTLLLAASQSLYTIVAQINVFLGAFMIIALTGDPKLGGLGTSIAWGGRFIIVYHSGKLMDRFGRTRVLMLGTILCILGAVLVAFGLFDVNLVAAVLGLVVYGLGVGVTNQNRVAVADMFPAKRRGEGIGYLLTASVAGALVATPFILAGSILASILGFESLSVGYMGVLWLTSIIVQMIAFLLTYFVRPDPKLIAENLSRYYPDEDDGSSRKANGNGLPSSVKLSSFPVLATFLVSGLAQGNMTMDMAWVSKVLEFHHTAPVIISTSITLHIVGMYALSTPLGRASDRLGRSWILMLGAGISGIGALLTPLGTDFWTITVGIFLVGLGWSSATVAATALLSDMSGAGARGRLIGVNDVFLGAAALIFPTTGGLIMGSALDFRALAAFGFLASIPALFLAFFLRKRELRNVSLAADGL